MSCPQEPVFVPWRSCLGFIFLENLATSSWWRAELNQYCLGQCTVLSSLTRLPPGPQGLGERSSPLHITWRFCTLQGCRLVSTGRRDALVSRPSKYLTWCPSQVPARLSVSITVLSVVPGEHVLTHFDLGVLILPNQGTLHGSLVDAEKGGQRKEAGIQLSSGRAM